MVETTGRFWNRDNVRRLREFLEGEWKSENFTTRELMQSYKHTANGIDEYIPENLINEVLA